MKRIFITILCLGCICAIYSQEPTGTNAFEYADKWHGVEYDSMEKEFYGVTYYLYSDTIIGDYTYRTLWRINGYLEQPYCAGALRQSDKGTKVYYYNFLTVGGVSRQEYLLYDFTANIGDTIHDAYFRLEDMRILLDIMGEPTSTGWVVADKYIQDGRIHMIVERVYNEIDIKPRYRTHWIQGVGTPNILWPTDYGVAGPTTLYALCASNGDEMLYSYNLEHLGIVNDCTEWHLKEDALNNILLHGITISANGNSLLIQSSIHLSQAKIYTINGQCVMQAAQADIDVSALPQGMYILRALTADGQEHQAKFIKQ